MSDLVVVETASIPTEDMTDREVMIRMSAMIRDLTTEVTVCRKEIYALSEYVKELDNKARAFGDPANMEKIMSGMLGNMMGM
jgi:hypothetical protein